jgi:hypothetical protein
MKNCDNNRSNELNSETHTSIPEFRQTGGLSIVEGSPRLETIERMKGLPEKPELSGSRSHRPLWIV